MTRIAAFLLLLALAAFAAPNLAAAASDDGAAAFASTLPAQEEGGESSSDSPVEGLSEAVIWTLVSLGIFVLVGGVLYFMKRQMGGFPENPSWVAPITIMQSKDFPDEGDFADATASHAPHAEH